MDGPFTKNRLLTNVKVTRDRETEGLLWGKDTIETRRESCAVLGIGNGSQNLNAARQPAQAHRCQLCGLRTVLGLLRTGASAFLGNTH